MLKGTSSVIATLVPTPQHLAAAVRPFFTPRSSQHVARTPLARTVHSTSTSTSTSLGHQLSSSGAQREGTALGSLPMVPPVAAAVTEALAHMVSAAVVAPEAGEVAGAGVAAGAGAAAAAGAATQPCGTEVPSTSCAADSRESSPSGQHTTPPDRPADFQQQPSSTCRQEDWSLNPSTSAFTTACLVVNPAAFEAATLGNGSIHGHQQQQQQPEQQHLHPERAPATAGASGAAAAAPSDDAAALQRAVLLLRQGHVVAMPTETVYGLAANALDAGAVRRIFHAKGRPADNPLIVHISSMDMLHALYPPGWVLPAAYAAAVAALWPGPLTLLLPRSPLVPDAVTCGLPTMAVRMPSHPVARALIHAAGFPLAAPSANASGRPSPTTAAHVMRDLAGRVPLVLDGGSCGCGVESTVLDALRQPPAVLRPGGATFEQLRVLPGLEGLQVYSRDFVDTQLEEAPTTPGMKYRHYSPDATVVLIDVASWTGAPAALAAAVSAQSQLQLQRLAASGLRRLALLRTSAAPGQAPGLIPQQQQGATSVPASGVEVGVVEYFLGGLDEPKAVAHELFCALRLVDELGLEAVVVEGVREADEGCAVMNRLRKAATRVVRLGDGGDGDDGR